MVDGAIILDWTFPTKEIEKFAERGHSIVVLDRTTEHRNIRQVLLDNRGGATRVSNLSTWVQKFFCFLDQKKVMIAKKGWLLVHEN